MIEIVKVSGLATIQDGGRPGLMHTGVPRSGAMVRELLARANGAARNAPDEAAIEAFGAISLVAHEGALVGLDDAGARRLRPGERLDLPAPSDARVRYVAVRGGFDVPRVLGARATLIVAGIGGHEGRALRAGDRVPVGTASAAGPLSLRPARTGPIRVVPGPDDDAFEPDALARLLEEGFTIAAASDRTGTRLDGPTIAARPAPSAASGPMVRGAIEITPDGQPIVLGPDHPTTGGYPVIACVIRADLGRFMRIPVGGEVRFARAEKR